MNDPILTGQTTSGKPVVFAHLFRWKDQEGIPLASSAAFVVEQGCVTDWIYEIEGALWIGYTQDKILTELREVFLFLHPGAHKELLKKMEQYFDIREKPNALTFKAMAATKV